MSAIAQAGPAQHALEAAFMRRFGILPAKYAGSDVKLESEDIGLGDDVRLFG